MNLFLVLFFLARPARRLTFGRWAAFTPGPSSRNAQTSLSRASCKLVSLGGPGEVPEPHPKSAKLQALNRGSLHLVNAGSFRCLRTHSAVTKSECPNLKPKDPKALALLPLGPNSKRKPPFPKRRWSPKPKQRPRRSFSECSRARGPRQLWNFKGNGKPEVSSSKL